MFDTVTEKEAWAAVQARDLRYDDRFVYGVLTTGIYCRPTCPARRPNRRHTRFFENAGTAERAGFRPCRRCRPGDPERSVRELVTVACRRLEQEALPLDELAGSLGLSARRLRRLFVAVLGVTPRAFRMARRRQRMRALLPHAERVIDAMYAAGFGAPARLYGEAEAALGMEPDSYRRGGAGARIAYALCSTSLGWMLLAATGRGICALEFGDHPGELEKGLMRRFPAAERIDRDPRLEDWMARICSHLDEPSVPLDLPLDIRGTAFQEKVWRVLRTIPPGRTIDYGELAERIGRPSAVRAAAAACGANPVALLIPCHRVRRRNGTLGGWRWGVERKRRLLEIEQGLREKRKS